MAGAAESFADRGGQSGRVVCKHPEEKHMAYACKCFWKADVGAEYKEGVAGIRLFFSILAGSYLQRVPAAACSGAGNPKTQKKKKKAAQMFPLSVLLREAAAFVLRSAFLADKSGMQGRPVSGGLCPQTSDPLVRLPVGRAASRGVISQTLHYVACVALAEFLCLSELLFFIYEWARGQGSQILKLSIYEELFVLNKSV